MGKKNLKSKNQNRYLNNNILPSTINEAIIALEIMSFYKPNQIKVTHSGCLVIERRHPAKLHFLLYLILFALPFVLHWLQTPELISLSLLYYAVVFLFIKNICQKTHKIKFDFENQTLQITNNDFLGMLFKPKRTIKFNEISTFDYKPTAGKFGKNHRVGIFLELKNKKQFSLFELAYENINNENAKMATECLRILLQDTRQ